jgi:hypothetical protein
MKTVLLVILASVLAWAASIAATLDSLFVLTVALAGFGLVRDAMARRRASRSPPRGSPGASTRECHAAAAPQCAVR